MDQDGERCEILRVVEAAWRHFLCKQRCVSLSWVLEKAVFNFQNSPVNGGGGNSCGRDALACVCVITNISSPVLRAVLVTVF